MGWTAVHTPLSNSTYQLTSSWRIQVCEIKIQNQPLNANFGFLNLWPWFHVECEWFITASTTILESCQTKVNKYNERHNLLMKTSRLAWFLPKFLSEFAILPFHKIRFKSNRGKLSFASGWSGRIRQCDIHYLVIVLLPLFFLKLK